MLDIGLIGTGNISKRVINALKNSDIRIVNVYSRDFNRAKKFAKAHDIKNYCNEFNALCSTASIIYIANPTKYHSKTIIQILKRNRNVICEKPLVLNKSDFNKILLLTKEKQKFLYTAYKTRYNSIFDHLKTSLKLIGTVYSAYFTISAKDSFFTKNGKSSEQHSLHDLYFYPLALSIELFNDIYLSSINVNFTKRYTDEHKKTFQDRPSVLAVSYLHKNDVLVNFQANFNIACKSNSYIYGSKGYIEIDNVSSMSKIKIYNYPTKSDSKQTIIKFSSHDDYDLHFLEEFKKIVKSIVYQDKVECFDMLDKDLITISAIETIDKKLK